MDAFKPDPRRDAERVHQALARLPSAATDAYKRRVLDRVREDLMPLPVAPVQDAVLAVLPLSGEPGMTRAQVIAKASEELGRRLTEDKVKLRLKDLIRKGLVKSEVSKRHARPVYLYWRVNA